LYIRTLEVFFYSSFSSNDFLYSVALLTMVKTQSLLERSVSPTPTNSDHWLVRSLLVGECGKCAKIKPGGRDDEAEEISHTLTGTSGIQSSCGTGSLKG